MQSRLTAAQGLGFTLIASMLALTGCAGAAPAPAASSASEAPVDQAPAGPDTSGVDEQADDVYAFGVNMAGQGPKVTVVLPAALRDALGDAVTSKLPIDGYVLTSRKLAGLEYCAADVAIDFADGDAVASEVEYPVPGHSLTRDELSQQAADEYAADPEAAREKHRYSDREPFDDWLQAEVESSKAPSKEMLIAEVWGTEAEAFGEYVGESDEALAAYEIDRVVPADVNIVTAVTGDEFTFGDGEAAAETYDAIRSQSELDDDAPEPGVYVADDLSSLTVVTDCAVNPYEEGTQLQFPEALDESEISAQSVQRLFGDFATFNFSVMVDGTITVQGTVTDYTQDANYNWVAN